MLKRLKNTFFRDYHQFDYLKDITFVDTIRSMKNIYQVLAFLILFTLTQSLKAQERFERRYPVISSSVTSNSLATAGQGYASLGIEVNLDDEKENINVTFFDKKGTVNNSVSVFYGDSIKIQRAGQIIRLADGTYLFSAVLAKDSLNKVITRIDGFGNHFWTVITGVETDLQSLSSAPSLVMEVPIEKIYHAHVISGENNTTDVQLTSIDYNGEIEFVRRISFDDGSGTPVNERFLRMQLAADSTIMILGTTDNPNAPVFLTKMDTTGNILWTRSYNGDFGRVLDTDGYDFVQLIDGTWVILGSVLPTNTQRQEGFIMKIDGQGNLLRTEAIRPASLQYQLYANGIVGTKDTSVIAAFKRHDMTANIVQPLLVKYDLDSIIDYQILLDTVSDEDLFVGALETVDSISATYYATTVKDDNNIPMLSKVDEQGKTNCEDPVIAIQIDTVNFSRDTLSVTITELMVDDSVQVETMGFGRFDPPTLILRDTTYCPQDPVNYFVDASVRGGSFYIWDDGNMDSTRTFTEEGMFMVTVTVIEDICFTLCDTVTISQLDFPQVSIAKNFGNYCTTGNGILVAEVMASSIESFEWSTGSTEQGIVVDGTPMNYSVTITDGCGNSAEASVSVSESDYLMPNPLGLQVSDENLCVDGTLTITATAQTLPEAVTWSTGATNTLAISVSTEGTYSADVSGFCPDSESINIGSDDFIPPVAAEITFECATPAILRVVGTGFVSQTWSTGETTSAISINEVGTYSIVLVDECGVENTSTEPFVVTAEILDQCTNCDIPCLLWPNAFQPRSNDPDNVSFGPKLRSTCTTGLASYELNIFNRWGKNIFTSEDVNLKWNGEVDGNPQPGGVYYYWSRYNDGLTTCERKGDVTLLR